MFTSSESCSTSKASSARQQRADRLESIPTPSPGQAFAEKQGICYRMARPIEEACSIVFHDAKGFVSQEIPPRARAPAEALRRHPRTGVARSVSAAPRPERSLATLKRHPLLSSRPRKAASRLRAGKRVTAIISLPHSPHIDGHYLYAHLKDLLERLPKHPAWQIDE